MEEMQIQTFVHRASTDAQLREDLRRDPDRVIMREEFSPRVSRIVARLVPHLTLEQPPIDKPLAWWSN
jgi:hypothetical protein